MIFLFLKKGTNHPERDTQSSNTGCHGDEKSGEKTLHLLQFVVHTNSPGLCLFGVFFFYISVLCVGGLCDSGSAFSIDRENLKKEDT